MVHQHDGAMIVALLRIPYQAALAQLHARLRAEFSDLHAAQLIVFQLIEHPPAGSRLTALAKQAQMTKQAMGQLVDALERAGYVERIPDPVDRRAKQIRLTARGWAVHERGGAIVAELQASWAAALGPGRLTQLLALLNELRSYLATDPLAER
jgi:DNA-binding MarR family transcriptional regulator